MSSNEVGKIIKRIAVSVIIPCYRCRDTIERAINSIAEQTVLPDEVFLVDDYSSDGTLEMLQALENKYHGFRIRVVALNKNRGPAAARNYGWELAANPYIAFLDADDSWHPQKLELQYDWMVKHSDVDISGHYYKVIKENDLNSLMDHEQFIDAPNDISPVTKNRALVQNPFATSTVMLKREIECRFDEEKYYSEDFLLWLTIILKGLKAVQIQKKLAYRYAQPFGESGLSKNMLAMLKGNLENYSRLQSLGLLKKEETHFYQSVSVIKFIRRTIILLFNNLKRNTS
jgi:glycosyltransferase involved in cell wall biosynthesis